MKNFKDGHTRVHICKECQENYKAEYGPTMGFTTNVTQVQIVPQCECDYCNVNSDGKFRYQLDVELGRHLTKADLTYVAKRTGYDIFYKGKWICGAGISSGRGTASNVTLFKQEALHEIELILSGNAGQRVYDQIRKIEQEA